MVSERRALPDSLDPLVDTLSNVVGILVVMVAVAQVQVGDAASRLRGRETAEPPAAAGAQAGRAPGPTVGAEDHARVNRVLARGGGSLADSAAAARELLARFDRAGVAGLELGAPATGSAQARRGLRQARDELEAAREALARRRERLESLRAVSAEQIARLPDPQVLTGEPIWILCRYGRIWPTDRAKLIARGEQAIGRILIVNRRRVELREYAMLASYLRKRDVGLGELRWHFVTDAAAPRARLVWESKDAGLEPTGNTTTSTLEDWLDAYDPQRHFIQFQVWPDSFEAYLAARQLVESAGFRAGWVAHDRDEEFDVPVRFGEKPPPERPVEVD